MLITYLYVTSDCKYWIVIKHDKNKFPLKNQFILLFYFVCRFLSHDICSEIVKIFYISLLTKDKKNKRNNIFFIYALQYLNISRP